MFISVTFRNIDHDAFTRVAQMPPDDKKRLENRIQLLVEHLGYEVEDIDIGDED